VTSRRLATIHHITRVRLLLGWHLLFHLTDIVHTVHTPVRTNGQLLLPTMCKNAEACVVPGEVSAHDNSRCDGRKDGEENETGVDMKLPQATATPSRQWNQLQRPSSSPAPHVRADDVHPLSATTMATSADARKDLGWCRPSCLGISQD
jgi:hypothetical protein